MPQKKKKSKSGLFMRGGRLMSPAQFKKLINVKKFKTMPVRKKQMGNGCGCNKCGQYGGNIFNDIGGALTGAFHNPLRGLAAVATLGSSELIAAPADLFKRTTGKKASKFLNMAAPVAGLIGGPDASLGTKLTAFGLDQVGLGRRRKKRRK
jgi:hypothetical protein